MIDRAASVLKDVFGHVSTGFAFRLWDGTDVPLGAGPPRFTVVIPTPRTFAHLLRRPTPYAFAEAYVEGAIDIEGDLFSAMDVANELEDLQVPLATRLRIIRSLWAA
ncbi:MAG TPA: hypothetical protein VGU22_01710 [Methylomirabilota bacterium]|jgi:cyclopropane-fatty-acyl-phospholipid synthase|nr:hypothetical protein [Methylomirabilota bacterium]